MGYNVAVAPRAGAWIEIEKAEKFGLEKPKSHPVRVRGLK